MKRILVLGICALFIACNSSTQKANETDSVTTAVTDTSKVVAAAADSVITAPASPATATVESTESKAAEVKTKEAPAAKVAQPASAVKAPELADNSDVKKGEELISKSDCFACHKINEKLLGPSYKDVANKYSNTKANVDLLVNKIKTGGSGVWGAIPMSPHPALSDDDAKAMVHYVLSLK
ncbi:MAG: c-type cytochrome [Pedobacter sp.]|jgi:cytochrome c